MRIGKGIAGRRGEVILDTKGSRRDKATSKEYIDSNMKSLNTDHIDL